MPICDTCDDFLENTECPLFIIYVHCLIYHVHNIMFILWLYYGYIINIYLYIYIYVYDCLCRNYICFISLYSAQNAHTVPATAPLENSLGVEMLGIVPC